MPVALPDLPQTEAIIVEMTNALRVENHLSAVTPEASLQRAAQAFADYLVATSTFAHTADGRQPADRAKASGYHHCIVAENIASHQSNRGFETLDLASRAVDGWKNSAAHRANLLQPYVTQTGIGIARSLEPEPKFVTVQMFGRPDSFKYSFEIENRSAAPVVYKIGDQTSTVASLVVVTHTACLPRELTFDFGKVTSKFEARDGASFVVSRGANGRLRVDLRQQQTVLAASASTGALAATNRAPKIAKSRRPPD